MAKPKPVLIIGAIVGVLVVASGVVLPWYFLVYQNKPSEYPKWDLEFFGDTVDQNVNVTYEDIRDEFNLTTYHFNQTKWWDSDGYESVFTNFSGVALWDLIEYSGVDYGSANALRFVGNDGLKSPEISMDVVENNKSLIIVYYIEDDQLLTGLGQGGDGYLMSAVNYSINEEIKSSHFNVKWLVGVEFVIDWDVSLFGESSIVTENKTISYNDILTHENLTRVNVLLNQTNPGISSELINVTGVTLWSIFEVTGIDYGGATHINFFAFNGSSTYNVSINDIGDNENDVLIVFEVDGELLNPSSDGYLMSMVDYSITEGYVVPQSGEYASEFLNGIEFVDLTP
ncbi:MAG: hypothetical protein ACTSRE_08940 [Promethearchaeota archaeon]